VSGNINVGGFIARNISGLVQYCRATGAVTGTNYVGGFVGSNDSAIADSYATGAVTGNTNVGGFAGQEYAPGGATIARCLSYGLVTGTSATGGFVGVDADLSSSVTDCFWDTTTSGQASSADGMGENTTAMQTQATYSNWDFTGVWRLSSASYPTLRGGIVIAPVLSAQPVSQNVATGYSVTLAVAAIGGGTFTYQWSCNGTPISGATSDTFTIPSAQPSDSGAYAVTVTNAAGSTISNTATLTVN
jgi:hypothetical protein